MRQFIISKSLNNLLDKKINLGDWTLFYEKDLPVHSNKDNTIILIGDAFQVKKGKPSPQELILHCEDIKKEEETWSGRYVLWINGMIYTDACALLGVFYSKDGISSNLELLRTSLQLPKHTWHPGLVKWYPGPHTPYKEIQRLLPSQTYDIYSNTVHFRNLLAENLPSSLQEEFSECMVECLKNIKKHYQKPMILALTGGVDSRTLLAFCKKADIPFECFLLENKQMGIGDLEIPSKICQRLGIRYTYIKRTDPKGYDHKKRYQTYMKHISSMVKETDRIHYALGQYEYLKELKGPIVVLRSNIWELASEYQRRAVGEKCKRNSFYNYYMLPMDSKEKEEFDVFFDWCKVHPLPITDTDRFYWEQKVACWSAENEHGFDLYQDIDSVQPLNCRYLLSMLLQVPIEKRLTREHQKEIIHYLLPELDDIPFGANEDTTKNFFIKVWNKIYKVNHRIKMIGVRRSISCFYEIAKDKLC